jgi:hypothetical protein
MARSSGNYGYSGLVNNLSPNRAFVNSNNGNIFSVRVISVILDNSHPRFLELGGWNALGAIEYDSALTPNYNLSKYPVAYPLFSNIKQYPLIQETVLALSAFSSATELFEENINILSGENKIYYLNSINVWNHPHHNGYSFNIKNSPPSQNKSYQQVEAGNTNKPSDSPTTINLGKTFKERNNINPLLSFEGDIIYEGRWGNSIRFGSTITSSVSSSPNTWSESGVGSGGDPIIIIRNGQGEEKSNGSEPVLENIGKDISSIYVTSTQKIPLEATSTSYVSYNKDKAPTSPKEYAGAQIMLDSGRLVFNSYSDHILLSSAKSINLNSQESVNIDTKKFITQADKIFLGKEDLAKEPLLLGDTTAQLLRDLVSSVKELAQTLQSLQSAPVPPNSPAIFPTLLVPATKALGILTALETQLGSTPDSCTITSKRNFTL